MSLDPFGLLSRFDDDWFGSREAVVLFSLSAISSIAALALFAHIHPANMLSWAQLPLGLVSVAGPVGLALIYFGMWVYWVRLDDSAPWNKRAWFLILLLGPWFGSCLYCFFVYLPQVLRKNGRVAR